MQDINAFREEVRGLVRRKLSSFYAHTHGGRRIPEADRAEYVNPDTKTWLERCAERGFTVPTWPKEYGGAGLNKDEHQVLRNELGRINARPPLFGGPQHDRAGIA